MGSDDVNFRLPYSQNFNDSKPVPYSDDTTAEWVPDHTVCVTLTNTSGILFLTFMSMIVVSLISSSVITARRCWLRRQKLDKKLAAVKGNGSRQKLIGTSTTKENSSKQTVKKMPQIAIPPKKLLEQQKCSKK